MSLENDMLSFRRVPLFSHFSDDQLRLLAFSAESKKFRDGDQLFGQGERTEASYVVTRGIVALVQFRRGRQVLLHNALAGDLIAESALIVETRYLTSALARGNVEAIRIRRSTFRRVLDEYPDVAFRLRDEIAARLVAINNELRGVGDLLDRTPEG